MGVIQKQSIKSGIFIMAGFALGAINIMFLSPKMISVELFGLTRIITDIGLTLATFCTFGSLPVINKFYPIYSYHLAPEKNDLPFVTLLVCLTGFLLTCLLGYLAQDIIVRKYSSKSPMFVEYYYMVFPFCLFILLFMWLESFSWSLKKSVLSNVLKEVVTRLVFTALLILFFFKLISITTFLWIFSVAYLVPFSALLYILIKSGRFKIIPRISITTQRLKSKMISFGMFIFGAQFLNLLSRTSDSIIIAAKSTNGLTDAAVFTTANYIVTLMEAPQRSLNSISVPVLAESWRNKDLKNIQFVYQRSVSNLLVIGLAMLCLLYLNIDNILSYLGKSYNGVGAVLLILGAGKLIDLGTGTNSQIIGTSSYWKVDFTTNVIYTVISLPLNYVLISRYNMLGAAYATIVSQTFYNLLRFLFLWKKFGLQPYSLKHLLAIAITFMAGFVAYTVPEQSNLIVDTILRTGAFLIVFIPLIYKSHISEEINNLLRKQINRILPAKRKL